MDANEKVARKIRRGVFRLAEECSRVFKTDVSVQPDSNAESNGGWVLGIVGIGTLQLVPNENIATGHVISHKQTRKGKRKGKRRSAGKRQRGGSGGVDGSGSEAGSN